MVVVANSVANSIPNFGTLIIIAYQASYFQSYNSSIQATGIDNVPIFMRTDNAERELLVSRYTLSVSIICRL